MASLRCPAAISKRSVQRYLTAVDRFKKLFERPDMHLPLFHSVLTTVDPERFVDLLFFKQRLKSGNSQPRVGCHSLPLSQSRWIARRLVRTLPTHHFHVVFTLPPRVPASQPHNPTKLPRQRSAQGRSSPARPRPSDRRSGHLYLALTFRVGAKQECFLAPQASYRAYPAR